MQKVKQLISSELKTTIGELKSSITDVYSESILHLKDQIKKDKEKIMHLELNLKAEHDHRANIVSSIEHLKDENSKTKKERRLKALLVVNSNIEGAKESVQKLQSKIALHSEEGANESIKSAVEELKKEFSQMRKNQEEQTQIHQSKAEQFQTDMTQLCGYNDKQLKLLQKSFLMVNQKVKALSQKHQESVSNAQQDSELDATKEMTISLKRKVEQIEVQIREMGTQLNCILKKNENIVSDSKESFNQMENRTEKLLKDMREEVRKDLTDMRNLMSDAVTTVNRKGRYVEMIQQLQADFDSLRMSLKYLDSELQIKEKQRSAEFQNYLTRLDKIDLKINVLNDRSSSSKMVLEGYGGGHKVERKSDNSNSRRSPFTKSQKERLIVATKKPSGHKDLDRINQLFSDMRNDSGRESSKASKSEKSETVAKERGKKNSAKKSSKKLGMRKSHKELSKLSVDLEPIRLEEMKRSTKTLNNTSRQREVSKTEHSSAKKSRHRDGRTSDEYSKLSIHSLSYPQQQAIGEGGDITLILDEEGYLMKKTGEYLTDDYGSKVKLTDEHLQSLKLNDQYSEVEEVN